MFDVTKSKELLEGLLFIGTIVSPDQRMRLRIACRKFKNPEKMALGLFLDAIRYMESVDKRQN